MADTSVIRFSHYIPYALYSDMVYWCTSYAPSYIASDQFYDVTAGTPITVFEFEDEADAIFFQLRWQ